MSNYEREFRKALGFTNQTRLKTYFKANDFIIINWEKIEKLNDRLKEICSKINSALHCSIKWDNICDVTCKIDSAYDIMRNNNIIPHFNNQGRNPEGVYYNWMRGYIICEMFIPVIALLFGVSVECVHHIGQDDLEKLDTFARAATADLEVRTTSGERIRIEIQAGYTGVNDIKQSKIEEALLRKHKERIDTYIFHFDIFNGKAAILNISNAEIASLRFHSAFEYTPVLTIESEWFKWKLSEPLTTLSYLSTMI